MLRWGFPCPPGVPGNRAVTNVRNTGSSYWREWMRPEYRRLVPATAFCGYANGKPAVPHWFALDESRPLFAFPACGGPGRAHGAPRRIGGGRASPVRLPDLRIECRVAPIHPKAMPVILTTPEECDIWMTAPIPEALHLQLSVSGWPVVRRSPGREAGPAGHVTRDSIGVAAVVLLASRTQPSPAGSSGPRLLPSLNCPRVIARSLATAGFDHGGVDA